jgi:hypothetical protein
MSTPVIIIITSYDEPQIRQKVTEYNVAGFFVLMKTQARSPTQADCTAFQKNELPIQPRINARMNPPRRGLSTR